MCFTNSPFKNIVQLIACDFCVAMETPERFILLTCWLCSYHQMINDVVVVREKQEFVFSESYPTNC